LDTPESYLRYPGGDKLPKKMKVWLVQQTEKKYYGGVVSRSYNFNDFPDDEVLVKGVNHGKEYGAVGIGRHGNFLQWGYSASPSEMTDTGRKLFLNCIYYISKFNGKAPLVQRSESPRMNAIRLAALINQISDEGFFANTFPPDLMKKYEQNPDKLVEYYQDNFELIYRDKVFLVDDELKELDIESNRQISTLERLIELFNDPNQGEIAKQLLKRYTVESMATKESWQKWLSENRDRIYFSDFGGFKFYAIPEGYLESQKGKSK